MFVLRTSYEQGRSCCLAQIVWYSHRSLLACAANYKYTKSSVRTADGKVPIEHTRCNSIHPRGAEAGPLSNDTTRLRCALDFVPCIDFQPSSARSSPVEANCQIPALAPGTHYAARLVRLAPGATEAMYPPYLGPKGPTSKGLGTRGGKFFLLSRALAGDQGNRGLAGLKKPTTGLWTSAT